MDPRPNSGATRATPLERSVRVTLRQALDSGSITYTLFGKSVPQHKATFWYYFGGLAMVCFGMQLVTGILLLTYFEPTNNVTMKSLEMIIKSVPYGWLVRSLHGWGASFAIFFTLVHMFSAFFMKSYRAPRSVLWVTGVLMLALMLGFGYTGYLLPEMHGIDLRRFFALHVTVLPLVGLLLVLGHVSLAALLGSSVPIGMSVRKQIKFFPDFALGEAIVWLLGFAVLLIVAWVYPWEFNGAVLAPKSATVLGIHPDWYLLFLSALEQPFPGSLGLLLVIAIAVFWACVPFLDRKALHNEKSPVFTWIGVIVLGGMLALTTLAYFSVSDEKANAKLDHNTDQKTGSASSPDTQSGQSPNK